MIRLAGPADVDRAWPLIAEGLREACERTGGDISPGYLWQECRAMRCFLLVANDEATITGASVWRPETWGGGEVLRCLAMYGREDDFRDLAEAALAVMKGCGATRVMFEGRKGWARSKAFEGLRMKEVRTLYEIRE